VRRVRLHDDARRELAHEAQYYATISKPLGQRLVTAVEEALALAAEFPESGTPYLHGTRRVFTKRFPFSLVYLHRGDEVYVLALAPFKRRPGYWRDRRSAA
jgi:plasmid stabilization system protein ParE